MAAPTAQAHVGSPDVFFDGLVGPWPARITIRMPGVIPGRAEIFVQVDSPEPLTVTYQPLATHVAVSNAPPAEAARPVAGETNLYAGDLWLMTGGAYGIVLQVRGKSAVGTVRIPVNSVASTQLPLPPWLGGMLVVLGLVLVGGAMAIVAAAAGESTLPPGVLPGRRERRHYWLAATLTGIILLVALGGGWKWWKFDEHKSRALMLPAGWPDLTADVRVTGTQRILHMILGRRALAEQATNAILSLVPDHGKLLHLFLVRQPDHDVFAHLHPVREGNDIFEVALPPLPAGSYKIFCDLTQKSGFSSTATNSVQLPGFSPDPAAPAPTGTNDFLPSDPDDSWATNAEVAARENPGSDTICVLPEGIKVIWKAHPELVAQLGAGLHFSVQDAAGKPVALESYMGMLSHAAVLRADERVFAHLHPSGNYSMAAQMVFDAKLARETGVTNPPATQPGMMMMGGSMMMMEPPPGGASEISIPYEFPSPGAYRVWVQLKVKGRVMTAIFDATVK